MSAACSGFIYGLEMAKGWLMGNPSSKALVIGSEVLSQHVDWSDRSIAMLFGDEAGAVVLAVEDVVIEKPFSASVMGSDGSAR